MVVSETFGGGFCKTTQDQALNVLAGGDAPIRNF